MLTVQEVNRLGQHLLEGLVVLNDLFERGIAVKVLDGIGLGRIGDCTPELPMLGPKIYLP